MAVIAKAEWSSGDLMKHDQGAKSSPFLSPLAVNGSRTTVASSTSSNSGSDLDCIEAKVEGLDISSSLLVSSTGISYPSPPSTQQDTTKPPIPPTDPSPSNVDAKTQRNSNLPSPLQINSFEPKSSQQGSHDGQGTRTPSSASFIQSPTSISDSSSSGSAHPSHNHPPQLWAANSNNHSPRHGPLLTGNSSPALTPQLTASYNNNNGGSSNSLAPPGSFMPVPGAPRKSSVASLGAIPRNFTGFRGAPLGQTSDTESVLKQFDVYYGKVYIRGQLQKKNDLGLDGAKLQGEQWAVYTVELVGSKLRLSPINNTTHLQPEEMTLEEANVEMQDGPNGGTFTINWKGANRTIFQPVQQLSLGEPEAGSTCQDWVCAIRLSCYECSRLQEIYTSTLLRQPKFREQVAAAIEGPVKYAGTLQVRFWAGEEWLNLYVVISDQRGEETKKKKQGKVLQAIPIRGQIHFYENPKAKKPFVSLYNVSQAYAVCPSRLSLDASKNSKAGEEGSLIVKLEGDVVMQRENLVPQRKGFFSAAPPPSAIAQSLQALLPTGRSMFATFQVPNAVERTKLLLGTSEAFRIYGKPGPLLFDSPMDPAAMNFGCTASSLLQQELLIGLDTVLHIPQRGESLADVKFSFGEVLRKRLIAENPPVPQRPHSGYFARRHSTLPYGAYGVHENLAAPPMMAAMRARAYSGSAFMAPHPSSNLHPMQVPPWAGRPVSSYMPQPGPLASPYNQHLYRPAYASSNTSTDENDANLVTDEEGEDDEYPDSSEEDEDSHITPFRPRAGSLMAPAAPFRGPGSRKGSVSALSVQSGRTGRSGSFTSAHGVQIVMPGESLLPTTQERRPTSTVLELPSLHSFSDEFGIKEEPEEQQQRRMSAVVYPAQIVTSKNKMRRDSTVSGPKSAASVTSPSIPAPEIVTAVANEASS
ncbi:hypothetical protein BX616_006769 [Lobosporangium transversale]|nr:hypothetical protein BX616_006769 [Lobosporangium transversale]